MTSFCRLKLWRNFMRSRTFFVCSKAKYRYPFQNNCRTRTYTIWTSSDFIFRGIQAPVLCVAGTRGFCFTTGRCWKCHAELPRKVTVGECLQEESLFCSTCNVIQPLPENLNHFQIMGMNEMFDINVSDLTQRFRNLQRLLHPDKFSRASETEQGYSALQSSAVNRAYKVLLKPLSRGLYLLDLHGYSIEEGDSNLDPAFLMELMEKNEELSDATDPEDIRRIGKDNAVLLNALLEKLKDAFSKDDFPSAREILMRLKYYANIDEKVKEKLGTD